MDAIKQLPAQLQQPVEQQWEHLLTEGVDFSSFPADIQAMLPRVWASSEFVMQSCVRHPDMLQALVASGELQKSLSSDDFSHAIEADIADETALFRHLRRFRQRQMLRILWRDIAGWADLQETMADLSALAETSINFALWQLYQWLGAEYGTPRNAQGEPQQLVVLGMGKLGAWELNVSSDIDLIFTFAEEGQVEGGKKEMMNSEFFTRLAKKLIQALDQQTADGFVFRVDMRLRPFGKGGPLVASFNSMENYYQVHGRSWERYAMVKVRVVGGDYEQGEELLKRLRPFVYRRYLDYGAYESLRELKAMIAQEVKRKGMENNVKLGAGGIREIEFIAQVFQLIRGGRDYDLQDRRLQVILPRLAEKKLLPDFVVEELLAAYVFLRNSEHRIQGYQDKQTHLLPEDETGRLRLAFAMGFDDWESYFAELNRHRENVAAHFEQVFVAPQADEPAQAEAGQDQQTEIQQFEALWYNKLDAAHAEQLLKAKGFVDPSSAMRQLQILHGSRQYAALSRQAQTRLDRLMPLLLGALQQADNVDVTFERVLALVSHIAQRSVYLALLLENPMVLSQLIKLCSASPWIARYLQQYPLLLDELMDPRNLYQPPDRSALEEDMRQRMSQVDRSDVEQAMDVLRHFKQSNVLRVAAADIAEALPLMKVSDHLTWIAEVVLSEALEQAWQHLAGRHGVPQCASGQDKGFVIVGYGKLGGYELGYSSDLDMVFLHGCDNLHQETMADENAGQRPLLVPVFFARLGQRIIHLLTTHTPAGVLYEADMRLRPDGASGLLVTNLGAYRDYQLNKAWLWEHQALVRARVVAGDPEVAAQFAEIRRAILSQPRDLPTLRKEVLAMRQKMRESLCREKSGQFDLKQGRGGIVDIEFMVQYGVLAWAKDTPDLLAYTDNINLLKSLAAAGYLQQQEAEILSEAYRTFRARLHKMALQEQSRLVDAEEYRELSTAVQQIWQSWLENKNEVEKE